MDLVRKQIRMKLCFPLLSWMVVSLTMTMPSCTAQPKSPLSGHIELNPEWKSMIYMVKPRHFNEIAADYLGQVIDSASISSDGSFSFNHLPFPASPLLIELVVQKKGVRYANHLSDENPDEANYMPLVLLPEETVVVDAGLTNFQKSSTIENPSPDNQAMIGLRDKRLNAYAILQSELTEELQDDSLLLEKEDVYVRYRKVLMDYAQSTGSLEAGMVAIRWVSPTGDFERTPEFLHGQCMKWKEIKPQHPFTAELCAAADEDALPVMIGDEMPDYTMPLLAGDTMKLSTMLGSRMTLIDIWASWCAPCRKENREILAPLWASYKDKGLQIIGYSIDSNGASWKTAISKDGATWTHASHLSGDDSPFMEALRITTIPANYLLDTNGKVLAKNVFGEELKTLVTEYLK